MGEDLLSLKWNNHKPAFFHLLKVLREKGCYTDVTLACGTKFFAVHRLVLMACSDYFTEVFEHTQCQKPVIVLKDIKSNELESLLDYMYLGEVDVQQADLPGLIKAAECLKIKGLAVPDEDPTQTPQQDAVQSSGERPSKRRRQEREGRDNDRGSGGAHGSDRGLQSTTNNSYTQYSHSKTDSVEEVNKDIENDALSIKVSVPHPSEDLLHVTPHEQEAPPSQHTDTFHLPQEQGISPVRMHIHDTRLSQESRIQQEEQILPDTNPSQEVGTFPHNVPEIKTEHCDISEDIENGGLKSEVTEIRSDPISESPGGGGDFSHFLSVEESLAHHMFQQAQQAGPSGLHRSTGRDSGSEMSVEDGSNNRGATGGNLYPSHMLGEVAPEGTSSHANQSGSNGGPGGFFPRESVAQHHCPYCPQSFMFQSILKRHLRIHTGEKPFECPKCDYRSAYKYHVARHMKLHMLPSPRFDPPVLLSSSQAEAPMVLTSQSLQSSVLGSGESGNISGVTVLSGSMSGVSVSSSDPPE